jgi:DNA-binding LytR/AlgR family response regulator
MCRGGSELLQVAVCDDEKDEHIRLDQLFQYLMKSTPYAFQLHYFFSGEELLKYYAEHMPFPFHFLILDIEMNGMNGIETAKKVRSLPDRDVQIIFLTSYPEYMMTSFDVQTFQYLIKPVSFELLMSKVIKLSHYISTSTNRFVVIKSEEEQIVLRTNDIIAIVKVKHSLAKNKLNVITVQRQYIITSTMLEYATKLEYPFMIIHRSVIINLDHIRKFTSASVLMSNQDEFPIGRSKSKKLKDAYVRNMIAQYKEQG